MDRTGALTVVRLASVVVVVAAIAAQAIVLADAGAFDPTRFFAFFTILSNLIGVAAFAWLVARGDRPRSRGARAPARRRRRLPDRHLLRGDLPAVRRRRAAPARLGRRRAPQDLPDRRRRSTGSSTRRRRGCRPATASCGSPSRSSGPGSHWSAGPSTAGTRTRSWTRPTAATAGRRHGRRDHGRLRADRCGHDRDRNSRRRSRGAWSSGAA